MEIEDNQLKASLSPVEEEDKLNVQGLVYGVVGNLAFSANGPILRVLLSRNPDFTPYEILYWQGLSMLFMNYYYVKYNGSHILDVGP